MSSLLRKTIVSSILILMTVSFASAQTDLVDYISQKIYNDCSGQKIDMSYTLTNKLVSENKSSLINTSLTFEDLKEVVNIIVYTEPYDLKSKNFYFDTDNNGKNILRCGNKNLTVNYLTYYWDEKRIDPFIIISQKIENVTQKVEKMENYYNNVSGQSNLAFGEGSSANSEVKSIFNIPVTTREISISLFGGLFGSLFGGVSVYIILRWRNMKSKRK